VYALIGQVLQSLGQKQKALKNFNIAIDLDPKEAASLKASIDGLDDKEEVSQ
jgi:hypothetical protein